MDTKSVNPVNAANLNTITGLAADVKAVTDTLATIVVGIVSSSVSNAAATISDLAFNASTNNVTVAATDLSAIGGKTSGVVTVTNAVKIDGTTAAVTAALVTDATLVVAATAKVTISGVGNDVTAVNAILVKTSGDVTATSTDIADLIALNGKTSVDVDASFVATITSAATTTIDLSTANTGITFKVADDITGNGGNDTIDGGAGDDIIHIGNTGGIIEIKNFTAGDDLVFFTGAILNVVIDSLDSDNIQDLTATDPILGTETTIHFTGLGAGADAALFNIPSFTTFFTGSTITFA